VVALGISLLMVFIILSLAGFIFFVVGLTVSFLLGFWSKQKLGGITGDILGAGVELSETATLLIAAFMTAL
jgi:cobalamin synthase